MDPITKLLTSGGCIEITEGTGKYKGRAVAKIRRNSGMAAEIPLDHNGDIMQRLHDDMNDMLRQVASQMSPLLTT